jgi:rare lipoprotein A
MIQIRSLSDLRARFSSIRRAVLVPVLLAMAAAPLSASSDASDSSEIGTPTQALSNGISGRDEAVLFAAHFEPVIAPPRHDLQVPQTAVDMDSFDPPVEQSGILRNLGSGIASYYGRQFHGRRTASGERFDMSGMTAAHRTLPFGSLVRVTNPNNGRAVTVRINDRGPFTRGRTIDVSRAAAESLGMISRGHATVELELIAS